MPGFLRVELVLFSLCCSLALFSCEPKEREIPLQAGMHIGESVKIKKDTFRLDPLAADSVVLTISGDHTVVDFNGAVLISKADPHRPDQFKAYGIHIAGGRNIQIRNAVIRGFKVALIAHDADSLQIVDCDFSYNYRQRLKSTPARENIEDWMSYHHNEKDEWLRYGAGVYLKNCQYATVRNLRVTGGQNGLLLSHCNYGLFYNNTLHFNSGLGIGLYRSSHNRVFHNRVDWNIRGYSHGIYNRGQDSAGILAYEQSSNNTFAYNSGTHGGDGFFLWAGQSTMDSGKGGANGNLVYGNDFSHASNNGVEITFSSNKIVNNRLEDCDYGIWAGYSHHSLLLGNRFKNNQRGIAIEHGQANSIRYNTFEGDRIGIKIWEREQQPEHWGFPQKRNVDSKDYEIIGNVFRADFPLQIDRSREVLVSDNAFANYTTLLRLQPAEASFRFTGNAVYPAGDRGDATPVMLRSQLKKGGVPAAPANEEFVAQYAPPPLPDGMDAFLPEGHFRGRQYMLIHEWGPYDFRSPSIWLRQVEGERYTFALFGPEGNWKMTGGKGFDYVSRKRGAMPATIVADRAEGAEELSIELAFYGNEGMTTFGEPVPRGEEVRFGWQEEKRE